MRFHRLVAFTFILPFFASASDSNGLHHSVLIGYQNIDTKGIFDQSRMHLFNYGYSNIYNFNEHLGAGVSVDGFTTRYKVQDMRCRQTDNSIGARAVLKDDDIGRVSIGYNRNFGQYCVNDHLNSSTRNVNTETDHFNALGSIYLKNITLTAKYERHERSWGGDFFERKTLGASYFLTDNINIEYTEEINISKPLRVLTATVQPNFLNEKYSFFATASNINSFNSYGLGMIYYFGDKHTLKDRSRKIW